MSRSLRLFSLCLLSSWCVAASSQVPVGDGTLDDAITLELVTAVKSGDATLEQRCALLNILREDRQRVANLGVNADRLRHELIERSECDSSDPRENIANAFRQFAEQDSVAAERLFERALELAPSDKARADYLYARESRGYGGGGCAQALDLYPIHGPCLYTELAELGRDIGRQPTLEGRFAYWCLEDRYRQLAALTDDGRIADAAVRAANQYRRAGPTREQWRDAGYTLGQMVDVSLPGGQSCRTPVR